VAQQHCIEMPPREVLEVGQRVEAVAGELQSRDAESDPYARSRILVACRIVTGPAVEPVIAGAAPQRIVVRADGERVVAIIAIKGIITVSADERIVAAEAVQSVCV